MEHDRATLKSLRWIFKAGSSILALATTLWIGLSQPNVLILGICVASGLISLYGLHSSRQTLFAIPFLVSAIVMVISIFTSSIRSAMMQVTMSLQLLLLIYAAVFGNSTIRFEKILRRTKEPTELRVASSAFRALRTHVISLTGLTAASFTISFLFLLLGDIASFKLEPLFLVAMAIAILLLSLVFLGTNPPSTARAARSANLAVVLEVSFFPLPPTRMGG